MQGFPSKPLWLLLAALIVVDIVWAVACGFTIVASPAKIGVCVVGFAIVMALALGKIRLSPESNAMISCAFYMIVFTNAAAVLSYMMTSLNYPLLDAEFAKIDEAMGFDWVALLCWMNEAPLIGWTLTAAYNTSIPQFLLAVLILAYVQQFKQLFEYVGLFGVTALAIVILSGFLPAAGAYVHHAPAEDMFANLNAAAGMWHFEQFEALRDGSLRTVDLGKLEGLVTFPSFHTALAVVTAWAVRDVKYVFSVAVVLNGLVILSTLSEGGHYLIDVIGGGAIAVVSIVAFVAFDRAKTKRFAINAKKGREAGVSVAPASA